MYCTTASRESIIIRLRKEAADTLGAARTLFRPGHLEIPRPELRHAFVLRPLAELAPGFVDPLSGQSLAALWNAHPERDRTLPVVPLGDADADADAGAARDAR